MQQTTCQGPTLTFAALWRFRLRLHLGVCRVYAVGKVRGTPLLSVSVGGPQSSVGGRATIRHREDGR